MHLGPEYCMICYVLISDFLSFVSREPLSGLGPLDAGGGETDGEGSLTGTASRSGKAEKGSDTQGPRLGVACCEAGWRTSDGKDGWRGLGFWPGFPPSALTAVTGAAHGWKVVAALTSRSLIVAFHSRQSVDEGDGEESLVKEHDEHGDNTGRTGSRAGERGGEGRRKYKKGGLLFSTRDEEMAGRTNENGHLTDILGICTDMGGRVTSGRKKMTQKGDA